MKTRAEVVRAALMGLSPQHKTVVSAEDLATLGADAYLQGQTDVLDTLAQGIAAMQEGGELSRATAEVFRKVLDACRRVE